jgi:hypothetical protein
MATVDCATLNPSINSSPWIRDATGRPRIDRGQRDLIQRMSQENPLWVFRDFHRQ